MSFIILVRILVHSRTCALFFCKQKNNRILSREYISTPPRVLSSEVGACLQTMTTTPLSPYATANIAKNLALFDLSAPETS